jgi:hypothetical protein
MDMPTDGQSPSPAPPTWLTWSLLALFVFLTFECLLLAFAIRGPWFILVAPAAVCSVKAWDTWRGIRQAAQR